MRAGVFYRRRIGQGCFERKGRQWAEGAKEQLPYLTAAATKYRHADWPKVE
jgi:hypothetical protein